MTNRHLSRSIVLQTLFEWDFLIDEEKKGVDIKTLLRRNAKEFSPGAGDFSFMENLLAGILSHHTELDTVIEKAAPDWPLDKISPVDRNVLRLGLFELLFANRQEVPAKVAINEAIELAKTFGGEASGRFVNGVLGSVYKEMGEPGKDEQSPKNKHSRPFEKMPVEQLGGAVVFARHDDDIYLALVHDVFGHWTLSKGHVKEGEDVAEGTMRELKEELGLAVAIKEKLGENEYVASHPEKGKIRKHVSYFLAEAPFQDLNLGSTGGLDDAQWFKLSEIVNLNIYDDILPIVTKAIHLLLKKA